MRIACWVLVATPLVGCSGGSGAGTDAGADGGPDVGADAPADVPVDAASVDAASVDASADGGAECAGLQVRAASGELVVGGPLVVEGCFSAHRDGQLVAFSGYEDELGAPSSMAPGYIVVEDPDDPSARALRYFKPLGSQGPPFAPIVLADGPHDEVFVSYRLRYEEAIDTGGGWQHKLLRLLGPGDTHHDNPVAGITVLGSQADLYAGPTSVYAKEDDGNAYDFLAASFRRWVRVVLHLRANTEGAADGARFARFIEDDGTEIWRFYSSGGPEYFNDADVGDPRDVGWRLREGVVTVRPEEPYAQYERVVLPFYGRSTTEFGWLVSSVFVNDSPERVELCDAPTWSTCRRRVVQPMLERSANRIRAEVRLEGIDPARDDVYVYVFDADGSYNEEGLPLPRAGT